MLSIGFEMMKEDHCVYVKQKQGLSMILYLYVDDSLLLERFEMLNEIKSWLPSIFQWKAWVRQIIYLELNLLNHSKKILSLCQDTYTR